MHRIDTPDAVGNMFDEGDPLVPRLPTQVDSEILNAFQEELIGLLTQAAVTPVKNTNTQVLSSLVKMFVGVGVNANAAGSHPALGNNGLLFEGREPIHVKHGRPRLTIRGPTGTEYWITLNAKWVDASSTWTKDGTSGASSLALRLMTVENVGFGTGEAQISILRHDGSTGFADSAWVAYGQSLTQPLLKRPAATAPTLINSWTNTGGGRKAAGFWVDAFGVVHLEGTIGGGALASSAFTLPTYARPAAVCYFAISANSAFGSVSVNASGDVGIIAGATTNVSLDGISFGT